MEAYVPRMYHGGMNTAEQISDEFLTCHLCCGPAFRRPTKMLLCGHTFCLACLKSVAGEPARGCFACCPICGLRTAVPDHGGLSGLRNNIFVGNQIDRLLRSHNQPRGRDDTLYDIRNYVQECEVGGRAYLTADDCCLCQPPKCSPNYPPLFVPRPCLPCNPRCVEPCECPEPSVCCPSRVTPPECVPSPCEQSTCGRIPCVQPEDPACLPTCHYLCPDKCQLENPCSAYITSPPGCGCDKGKKH